MLNANEKSVGKEGLIISGGLEFSVIIRNVRMRPHAVDYLVEPTAGTGQTWIDGQRLRIVGNSL
jgi:hypothetical protein